MEDPYEVLCITRDATTVEIRKAYKKLALSHHPDKVPEHERPEAEMRFKVISEAYEMLIDPEKRAHYDQFGNTEQPNWQDYYDPGFGPDAFAEFFGFNGPTSPRRTNNAQFEIELSLEDIYKGKVFKVSSARQVICKQCSGSGGRSRAKPKMCGKCDGSGLIEKLRPLGHGMMTANRVPCDACNGKGLFYRTKDLCRRCHGNTTIEEKTVLEVYVPRGVQSGHQIVFKGKADEAVGKDTGDIVVTVQVSDHPLFQRQGYDLYARATISLSEALTGFSRVLISHLDGRGLKITVPRGKVTKPGQILKIRNEGMPKSRGYGDLYIELDVIFPTELDQSMLDSLASVLPAPTNGAAHTGDVQDVDFKTVEKNDLPEYKVHSDDGTHSQGPGPGPGCATM